MAAERHRAKVRRQRDDWATHRSPAIARIPDRVAFIDEMAVKTNLTRLRGWAPQGERLTMGAMDGRALATDIKEVLVKGIAPGTLVIQDNLTTHRNKETAKALRDHGCWFLDLPPYSPDLNPIEQAFSKLKAHLRRIGARTFTEVFRVIGSICDLHDPEEC